MKTEITVILWTAALFIAIIVNFAVKPRYVSKILGVAAVITGIGGILMYGYGYACVEPSKHMAVMKAAFAVINMFVGGNAFGDISSAPLFQLPGMPLLCWLLHLFGLFSSIGAVASKLGADLLSRLRLLFSFRGNLAVIYGVDAETVSFARQLTEKKGTTVVFVDAAPDAGCIQAIGELGCVLCTGSDALAANARFARSVGIRAGKRAIALYALQADAVKNQGYAKRLLATLQTRGVTPQQAALTLRGHEAALEASLQAADGHYGYGTVIAVDLHELAARVMIHEYPPCDTVPFDAGGRAQADFHALVVGFGATGQSALRHLVMNGQFVGSTFRAAVFDPACDALVGPLLHGCPELLKQYDLTFYPHDGRSRRMYEYLAQHADSLRYIVLSTGSDKHNQELDNQIREFLADRGSYPVIVRCTSTGVSHDTHDGTLEHHSLYRRDLLCSQTIDRTAMIINHYYCGSGTAEENWRVCDYFSRMSSRASADFAPAMLRAAGMTKETLLQAPWRPEGVLLETLAQMEHLRWNAFHFAMGFSPMPEEMYLHRAGIYREEKARTGASRFRIGKDMQGKRHACLVSWEALNALSARENAITGGSVDYQQMDRNNVYALADVLRAAAE